MSYYAEISFKKMESQDVISFLKDFKYAYIKKSLRLRKKIIRFVRQLIRIYLIFKT